MSTPMDRKEYLKLERSNIDPDPEILEWYLPAIGALLWITNVRLDISFAFSTMAQIASNPTPAHVSAVKRIFRYLSGTTDYVICYGDSDNPKLYGYVDSDWGGCQQTFRSTTGYIFFKNGGVVSHSSKRQPTVACSSTEAEYTALCQATKEAVWLRLLELEFEGETFPITLKTDNEGSIALAFNPEFHARTKHISMKTHYVREVVARGDVKLEWVEGVKNVADLLTKPLDRILFQRCLEATKLGPMQAHADGGVLEG